MRSSARNLAQTLSIQVTQRTASETNCVQNGRSIPLADLLGLGSFPKPNNALEINCVFRAQIT